MSQARQRSAAGESWASLLTPVGRGAVAVVAAEGPAALAEVGRRFRAANGRPLDQQPLGVITYGRWRHDEGEEDIVVCRHTPSEVEIHCHGGAVAAPNVLAALAAGGCPTRPWPEWLPNEDPLEVEVRIALAEAPTLRIASILLDQLGGALANELEIIGQQAANGDAAAAHRRLQTLRRRAALGSRLARPWRVALAGWANVGKSSLMNAVLGYRRAIVWDLPGVTRDMLTADVAIDGWPLELIDGAGLGATLDPLGAAAAQGACDAIATADLALWVIDAGECSPEQLAEAPRSAAAQIAAASAESPSPLVIKDWLTVVNKCDQLDARGGRSTAEVAEEAIAVSALTGAGIDGLLDSIIARLIPEPPPPGAAVPFTPRQVALVEAVLAQLEEPPETL